MLKLKNFHEYQLLMRTDKPIGTILLWWPLMWSLLIVGGGQLDLKLLLIFSAGAWLMRSAGCVINDFADREIDKHVERTQDRPLTSGRVTTKEALALFALLCSLAFVLVLFTNQRTLFLSFVAVFLASLYPFTKRWFMFPQAFLGAAFSWGVVMVFSAANQALDWTVLCLYVAVVCLTIAYDTFYAMVDQNDDEKIGVKSTAIWFGDNVQRICSALQSLFLILMIALGILQQFSWPYYVALLFAATLFVYQQQLISSKDREQYFKAFLNNQWVGMIVFVGIAMHYIIQ